MKIKCGVIANLYNTGVISKLLEEQIPRKTRLKIAQYFNEFKVIFEEYNKMKMEIIKKYANLDENGNPTIVSEGKMQSYDVDANKVSLMKADFDDLDQIELEFDKGKLTLKNSDIPEGVTPADQMLLMDIIEFTPH